MFSYFLKLFIIIELDILPKVHGISSSHGTITKLFSNDCSGNDSGSTLAVSSSSKGSEKKKQQYTNCLERC